MNKKMKMEQIDKFIGGKIYSLRLAQGLSRGQLSKVIGVTPQQLQKYENARNRVSASRLVLIAKALGKNISYFYEGLEESDSEVIPSHHQRLLLEVSRNFMKIENAEHKNAVNKLIRSLLGSSVKAAELISI